MSSGYNDLRPCPSEEDIIKALKCCVKPTSDCDNCPIYIKGDGDCVDIVKQRALGIINQQKADIDKLKLEHIVYSEKTQYRIIVLQNAIAEQKAEIDSLRKMLEEYEDRESAIEANDY